MPPRDSSGWAVTALAPRMEDRGIDEVYIDFDATPGGTEEGGRSLAGQIQQAVRASTGLSCSIGVAPNKLLAKMASELHKPNGITVLYASDLAERIWPLPCRRINGGGPKAGERLEQLRIRTIGELAQCARGGLGAGPAPVVGRGGRGGDPPHRGPVRDARPPRGPPPAARGRGRRSRHRRAGAYARAAGPRFTRVILTRLAAAPAGVARSGKIAARRRRRTR